MRIYWCMSSQNVPCCNIHTYKVWQRKTLSCHVWLYCCAYLPFSLQNIQKWGVARLLHSLTDHVPNLTVKYSHPTSFRVFFCFILLCMIIMVFIVTHLIGRLLLMLSFFLFFFTKNRLYSFLFLFLSLSAEMIISLQLQVSPRFPVHLTQQPTRTVLTGVEAWPWLPSSHSLSRSRAAGLSLPAPQEEAGMEVSVC